METKDRIDSPDPSDATRSEREQQRARASAYLDLWERNMVFAAVHASLASAGRRRT